MSTRTSQSFLQMCRAFPLRTALFTFGPILVALAQFVNAYVHDTSLPAVAAVCALMVVFSVLVTRYHLVSFRLVRLQRSTY